MTTKSAKTNGMTTKSAFNADFNRQDVITTLNNAFGKAMTWQSVPIDDAANFRKDADEANIETALYIGKYPDKIAVYDITLKPTCHIARARVGIKRLVTQLMNNYSYAILLFHYADAADKEWRISWVTRGGSSSQTNAAKRYTFLCGNVHLARTIADRLSNIEKSKDLAAEITKAFSVEALSDEFFDEYKAFYEDIVQYICGARYVEVKQNTFERIVIESETVRTNEQKQMFQAFVEQAIKEKPELGQPVKAETPEKQKKAEEEQENKKNKETEKLVRNYVKKLLGRLVFIQFLAKKGWMGLKPTDAWGTGKEDFLHKIYNDYQKNSKSGNFVGDVLNKVLFYSLNNTNGKEGNIAICSNNIAGTTYKFPYLNGGLFEETDLDKLNITIPGYFFVSNEKDSLDRVDAPKAPKNISRKFVESVNTKAKKLKSKYAETAEEYPYSSSEGLFEFFERYNFTIDENGSDEAVVGIDPEMLGKIFENLLEDNKDKGAFYTPKPVVEYMCQQSLIAYLQNGVLKGVQNGVLQATPQTTNETSANTPSDEVQKANLAFIKNCLTDGEIKSQIEHFVKTKSLELEDSARSRQGLGEVGSESANESECESNEPTNKKPHLAIELVSLLNHLLKEVKICDPAIGSGAFPMGLLNELLECREALANELIDNNREDEVFADK